MSIRVLFFASLADITQMREAEVDAAGLTDIGSILSKFLAEFPSLGAHRDSMLYALNSEFAALNSPVKDGDEVAFFPPVSGG